MNDDVLSDLVAFAGTDPDAEIVLATPEAVKKREDAALALGLPAKLEARRKEYGIPVGAFGMQAMFDRVLIWQISDHQGDTFKGTSIVMSERSKARTREEAPRGVIVSAGLRALDFLRTNGSDIGNIVRFVRLSPWRMPVDFVDAKEVHLMVIRAGDIIADEDIDRASYEWSDEYQQHLGAFAVAPQSPDPDADY